MQTTPEPTATHSPTPWERDGLVIRDHDGNRVLSIHKSRWADNRDDPEAEADAAFIVEAVNAHADLLRQRDALAEALRDCLGLVEWARTHAPNAVGVGQAERIRSALASLRNGA